MFHIRMKNVLRNMEDIEILNLKKDINSNNSSLLNMINQELRERENKHKSVCSSCGNNLDKINKFTLLFGPDGFKKRASFCGIDCMEEFLNKIKENKKMKFNIKEIN